MRFRLDLDEIMKVEPPHDRISALIRKGTNTRASFLCHEVRRYLSASREAGPHQEVNWQALDLDLGLPSL